MFPTSAFQSAVDLARTICSTLRNEDEARELVVAPLLGAAGYQHGAIFTAERGFQFRASQLNRSSGGRRHHVFPDLVLTVNDEIVWIVEVKAPSVPLLKERHLTQLRAYLQSAGPKCRMGILTNGARWCFFRLMQKGLVEMRSIDILRSRRHSRRLQMAIDPSLSYLRDRTTEEVYDIYLGGDWLLRNICMSNLRSRPLRQRRRLFEAHGGFKGAQSVRERALPAILLGDDFDLIEDIFERAMNDTTDTVRDTAFTIVRSLAASSGAVALSKHTLEAMPNGWFSRIAYAQMLAALVSNSNVPSSLRHAFLARLAVLERDDNPLVRSFARFGSRGAATPFPFSALTHLPTHKVDQDEIDRAMISATVRVAVDDAYASESRTSALDAVHASRFPRQRLRELLLGADWRLFEELSVTRDSQ